MARKHKIGNVSLATPTLEDCQPLLDEISEHARLQLGLGAHTGPFLIISFDDMHGYQLCTQEVVGKDSYGDDVHKTTVLTPDGLGFTELYFILIGIITGINMEHKLLEDSGWYR